MSFTYISSAADWARIAPELVLAAFALLTLLVDLVLPQTQGQLKERGSANFWVLPALGFLGVLGSLAATIVLFLVGDQQRAFAGMLSSDWGTLYAYLAILTAAGLGILMAPAYLKRLGLYHQGEFYALVLLATIGMQLLVAASSFMLVFLGIEMLSLALYVLSSYITRSQKSQESGMKYFLLSSFASAFLLYGIALIYGATGSTRFGARGDSSFPGIIQYLATHHQTSTLLLIGMGLLMVGFVFKISAIPFHAWTPDVYEGAPVPVTAFMSVGTKAAALVAFARVFVIVLGPLQSQWMPVVWAITVLTLVGGNLLALVQSNVKRLLAYSSIAHAGYLLIGVVAGGINGLAAILFYLLSYAFLNLGAFGVLSALERADDTGTSLEDLRGLWSRRPLLAGFLAFFLLSLAGFPPMAGFAAKFYLFFVALQNGHPELLIIGVLASVLGMYYYLRVIASMFMESSPTAETTTTTRTTSTGSLPPEKRHSGRLSHAGNRGGAATAVAVRPTAAPAKHAVSATAEAEPVAPAVGLGTWAMLIIAAVGALAMGTVLPLWLTDLAQRAAGMM